MSNLAKWGGYLPTFFDRFWNDDLFSKTIDESLPAANVTESPTDYKIALSVPGYAKKDVSVEVDKNVLKISARQETKKEEKDSQDRVIRQEFSSSAFARSFTLPENVDTAALQANLADGVLNLVLPKRKNAPEDKVKKIEIK